jgi:hypothetical protein
MGQWRTEDSVLDLPVPGTLEIEGPDGEVRTLERTEFTYYNRRGVNGNEWGTATGEDARELLARVQRMNEEYQQAVDQYRQKRRAYDRLIEGLTSRLEELRNQGNDVSELMNELDRLEPPEPPNRRTDDVFAAPPRPLREGFVLDLPPGTYNARLITENGNVLQGSEKRVVAFENRREGTVGFEVIPADKWTRPETSHEQDAVIYVDGSTDLYLRPFHQREYNDLYYNKMVQNDARGNPKLAKWTRMQPVSDVSVLLRTAGAAEETVVERQPYFVEQVQGKTLGYRIIPYDPDGAHEGKDPSLRAFHVPISPDSRLIEIDVQDGDGKRLTTASREVRVVRAFSLHPVLVLLAAAPILVLIGLRLRRVQKLSKYS